MKKISIFFHIQVKHNTQIPVVGDRITNFKNTRANGWVRRELFDTKKYIFFCKEYILGNFTMKMHCRIEKCVHKLLNTKKELTPARTESLSNNFVFKSFGT